MISNLKISVLLHLVIILQFYNSFTKAIPARLCKHDLVSQVRFDYVNHEFKASYNYNTSEIKLTVKMLWKVNAPANLTLDGYLVKLEHLGSNDLLLPNKRICFTDYSHFLVNTTNTGCSKNSSLCADSTYPIPDGYRLCPASFFDEEPKKLCSGTGERFLKSKFISIPYGINEMEYTIDFQKEYDFTIQPYYRQAASVNFEPDGHAITYTISLTYDCPNLVRSGLGVGLKEATSLCCDQNVPHLLPRNVTFSDFLVDFEREVVNITVMWLPPIDAVHLYSFYVDSSPYSRVSVPLVSDIKSFPIDDETRSQLADCDNTEVYYKVNISMFRPSLNYSVNIRSIYNSPIGSGVYCAYDQCKVSTDLSIPEINVCEEPNRVCVMNATCSPVDETGLTSFNASCICPEGFRGNGIKSTINHFGTGCVDTSYCTEELNPCFENARCIDRTAPELGADCECYDGYFGDGITSCTSTVQVVLSTTIPLLLVLFVLIMIVAYRIYKNRKRKNDILWSQFVSNDALRTYTMINQLTFDNNEEDPCAPTFGEKWEIDRDRLTVGNILGRGNYGIVYKALLEKENEDGKFYDFPVAVKTVKEGADERNRLVEFLAEIGFMLNLGEHPNVLGVIGCCTTKKPVFLLTDYLKYGDLLHFLWDAREPTKCLDDPVYHLTERSLYLMAKQVAKGMNYLTKSRIIHGDIAARNILVGEKLTCKISDFGLANDVYRYGVIQGQSERCVPLKWISPERMMAGKVPITSKSDVWSFGILLYEMVTLGCMPHVDIESNELLEKLKSGYRMKKPSSCNEELYSMMSKCWKWRPFSRPSFFDLIRMLDDALEGLKEHRYVNLADAVQGLNKMAYENEIDDEKKKHFVAVKKVEPLEKDYEVAITNKTLPENGAYVNITFDDRI